MAENEGENPGSRTDIKAPKPGTMSPLMKMVAIAVVVVLLIAVPLGYFILTAEDESEVDLTVTLVGSSGEEESVSYDDLEAMSFTEGLSSYQNKFQNWKGLGTYGGVELRNLTDLVGGMGADDLVIITASDGYSVNLSYEQVYASGDCLETQGRIILSYMFNGTLMSEEDRPMIAVLCPDEAFSNDDFNATCPDNPAFANLTSAGSMWVTSRVPMRI